MFLNSFRKQAFFVKRLDVLTEERVSLVAGMMGGVVERRGAMLDSWR